MPFRSEPMFRMLADESPIAPSMPSGSIKVPKYSTDLATATTPLSETTDPDAVALPQPEFVTVNIEEYG